ncbi:MAG: DUF222 domain-containing protein [Actinobacteria bacterium]|nr:DUF222 domain-containing protein [Actinomycetota bacterium]
MSSAVHDFTFAAEAAVAAGRALLPDATDHRRLRTSIHAVHALAERMKVIEAELLAAAEAREAWVGTGARNMADWLAGTTNSRYGDAKRKAKLGSALSKNQKLKDAVDAGEVSPDVAEQLADTINEPPAGANDGHLDELVDACKGASPKDARDAANLFSSTFAAETEEEAAERRHQARSLTFGPEHDGMIPVKGVLPAASADQLKKSLLHAGNPYDGDTRTVEQRLADGLTNLATAYAKGEVTGGRAAPQMLITMTDAARLGHSNEPAVTDLGTRVPACEARRLAELAEIRRVVMTGSEVLDLGRSYRYASAQQYLALVARDGGCIWPGCTAPAAWCDADHIHEWEHGGPTDLDLLALLCPHHHRERHRPGVWIEGDASTWTLHLADGTVLHRSPIRRPDQAPLFGDQWAHPPERHASAAA